MRNPRQILNRLPESFQMGSGTVSRLRRYLLRSLVS